MSATVLEEPEVEEDVVDVPSVLFDADSERVAAMEAAVESLNSRLEFTSEEGTAPTRYVFMHC